MPPSEQRTRKLLDIIAKENMKTGAYQRTPALFRECMGDTHKTMPAEYWGPSPDLVPPEGWRRHSGGSQMSSRRLDRQPGVQRSHSAARSMEFKSVFKPTAEQRHVCDLATTRRKNVENSEWALLDTLEVQMYNDERQYRQQRTLAQQAATRKKLDSQMRERQEIERQEAADRLRDGELVMQQVAAGKEKERMEAEARRAKALQVRNDTMADLMRQREQKAHNLMKKRMEEQEELARTRAQMDEEKRMAAERLEQDKKQYAEVSKMNILNMQMRKEAEAMQKKRDSELMEETIRTLAAKEKEREDALKEFHEKIEARAMGAGAKVVADRADREAREARLIAQYDAEAERKQVERERRERIKREKQKQELLDARKEFTALKEQRAEAERAEKARLKQEIAEREAYERAAEEEKMRMIRERAVSNRMFQTGQVEQRETQSLVDDVGMSERERYLNLRLLEQAVKIVGPEPRQLTADFS